MSYHFHSEEFKRRVRDVAVGQTMASINTRLLMGVKIILPPTKAEQEAIAEALSDVDDLIASLEQLIAKKRQIKQGAMQELLNGNKRISGFNGNWEVRELSEIGTFRKGKSISKSALQANGLPCVLYGEIYTTYDYVVKPLKSYIPENKANVASPINFGDILFIWIRRNGGRYW